MPYFLVTCPFESEEAHRIHYTLHGEDSAPHKIIFTSELFANQLVHTHTNLMVQWDWVAQRHNGSRKSSTFPNEETSSRFLCTTTEVWVCLTQLQGGGVPTRWQGTR